MVFISRVIRLLDIYNQEGHNGMVLQSRVPIFTSRYLWTKKTIKNRFKSPHFMVLSEMEDISNSLFLDFVPIFEYGKAGFNSDEPLCLEKSTFSEILGRAWIEYLAWLFCS